MIRVRREPKDVIIRPGRAARRGLLFWQGALRREPPVARQILRKVLNGRLVFDPREEEDGARFYEFSGPATLARLLDGTAAKRLVAPTGFEPVFQP